MAQVVPADDLPSSFAAVPTDDLPDSFAPRRAPEPPKEATNPIVRSLQDTGVAALKSAVAFPQGLVGIADIATGGRVGKFLENEGGAIGFRPGEAQRQLETWYSPETQAARRAVQDAEGFVGTVKAAVQNPSSIYTGGVESLASMGAGGIIGRGILAAAPKVGAIGAAALGEGAVMAGQAASNIREQTDDGLLTPEQALLSAGTGAAGAAIARLGGAAANRLGIGDIDTAIVGGATGSAKRGILSRTLLGGATEGGLEELPQSMAEQALENVALDRPIGQGVAEAGAQGLVVGAPFGMIGANITGRPAPVKPAPDAKGGDLDTQLGELETAVDEFLGSSTSPVQAINEIMSAPDVESAVAAAEQVAGTLPATTRQMGAALQPMIDRSVELTEQASSGFAADRESALEQLRTGAEQRTTPREVRAEDFADLAPMDLRTARGRLTVLRDQVAREGGDALSLALVPHPNTPGRYAISRRGALPSLETGAPAAAAAAPAPFADQRLERAATEGDFAQSRQSFEAQLMQQGLTRALQSVEARGGVATPEEAALLDRAYPNERLYDSVQGQPAPESAAPDARSEAISAARAQLIEQRLGMAPAATVADATPQLIVPEQRAGRRDPNRLERVNASVEMTATPALQATTSLGASPAAAPGIDANAPLERARPGDVAPTDTDGLSLAPESDLKPSDRRSESAVEQDAAVSEDAKTGFNTAGKPQPYRHSESVEVDPATLPDQQRAAPGQLSKQQHRLVKAIARIFGKKVVVFDSQRDDAPDGYVRVGDSQTIYLNVRSEQSALVVFGHELLHQIKADSPKAYKAILDTIKLRAGANINVAGLEGDMEEVTADLVGNLFADPKFWTEVFGQLTQREAIRLGDVISQTVGRFLRALGGMRGFNTDNLVENLKDVRQAAAAALAQYAREQRDAQRRGPRPQQPPGALRMSPQREEGADAQRPADVRGQQPGVVSQGRAAPRYGTARENALSPVTAWHFSQQSRPALSSSAYGTGLAGSGREQFLNAKDPRSRQRIYFYVDKGNGIHPESGVGGAAHEVVLNNVYDGDADPLRLKRGSDWQAFETALADAGFDGYLYRDHNLSAAVVLIGPRTVPVAYRGVGRDATRPGGGVRVDDSKAVQWTTQSSGPAEAMQAKAERMRGQASWADYDVRVTPASNGFASVQTRKKLPILNVGLSTAEVAGGGMIDSDAVRAALERMGVTVAELEEQQSDTETTAVVTVSRELTPDEGDALSRELQQEAIVLRRPDGTGELFGPKAAEWGPYNPEFFVMPGGERAAQPAIPVPEATEITMEDAGITENNASGESAASLEAQSRVRQERELGRQRVLWDRAAGIRPVTGVDGVDQRARAGQVLLQRGVGANEWTVLDRGPGTTAADVARAMDAAANGVRASSKRQDLFPDEFATKRTTVETDIVVSSNGDRARGGNVNSEGQQIAQTKQALKNFWSWFGTSEATDDRGRPLLMYHSTNGDIARFEVGRKSTNNYGLLGDVEVSRSGIFMTPSKFFSQEYLREGSGQNVLPVYASIKNPLDLRSGLSFEDERVLEEAGVNARYVINAPNYWELFDNSDDGSNDFVAGLRAAGYDGAIFREASPGGESDGGVTYVAFDPEQVKSATGNRGTFDARDPDIRFSARRSPISDRVKASADIANARDIATRQKWATNRDFKLAIQRAVREAAGPRDLSADTPDTREYLVQQILKEARQALVVNSNAIGWYDEKVTTALEVLSAIHPEIKTDEKSKFAFIWALAVTSNGLKVDKNFELAERAYGLWKASNSNIDKRRMPTQGIGVGTAATKINEALATYNKLMDRWGYDQFKSFATTLQPNRQVKAQYGRAVSGEGLDTMVYGAGVVGPKIGNGFFMNLYGEFGQLTMDRWWVRMWGRMTGNLVRVDRAKVAESRRALLQIIDVIKSDRDSARAVEAALGLRLNKSDPVATAAGILSATTSGEVRRQLASILPATPEREAAMAAIRGRLKDFVSVADELRKVAKGYYTALDGQVESPAGPRQRDMMRAVSQSVLAELQKDYPTLTMADFQALMWYPEKTLYDSAATDSEQTEDSYEDDEAPDYANAAVKLARDQGVPEPDIQRAIVRARSEIAARQLPGRGGRGTVGVQPPARDGAGADPARAEEVKASAKRQTETPEFKRWFGDSKVVDADGEPLVVYTGTSADKDFNKFKAPKNGIWFAADPAVASDYAVENDSKSLRYDGGRYVEVNNAPRVMPVYLALRNPKVYEAWPDSLRYASNYKRAQGLLWENLRAQGHDGVIGPGGTYVAFKPEQIKSAIGNDGSFDATDPDIRSSAKRNNFGQIINPVWTMPGDDGKTRFVYKIQDKFVDLREAMRQIEIAGVELGDEADPHTRETLYHGRTAKQTKDFSDFELLPLLTEMRDAGVTIPEFEEFLHLRHAEERNVQIARINPSMPDGGSGIDTATARQRLAGIEPERRAVYDRLAAQVDAIAKRTRDFLVASGLETRETIDAWEAAYKSYVPLNRAEYEAIEGNGTGLGMSVRGPASKRAMGSSKDVRNILANLARQREAAILRAEKNRVGLSIFAMFAKAPNPEIAVPVTPKFFERSEDQVVADLMRVGLQPEDALNIAREAKQRQIGPDGTVQWRVNAALRSRPEVLALRVNGQDNFVFFNPNDARAKRLVDTLKNQDMPRMGPILGLSAKVTRWFAAVNTQYNPVFGIYNFMRDSGSALVNLSSTPLAGKQGEVSGHVLPALRGIWSSLRSHRKGQRPTGTWADLWEDFQQQGGQTGFRDMFATPEDRQANIKALYDPASWTEEKWGKVLTIDGRLKAPAEVVVEKMGRPLFQVLSDYNEMLENAWRLAAYKTAIDGGMSKQQAANLAKSLTVNFNRKGEIATHAGALYAFFNAATQGTARLYETLKGPAGRRVIAGGLLLGAVQAAVLALAGFDDDEPPEWQRDRNLIVPIGDGKFLALPLPLGLHAIPATSRRLVEFAASGFRDPHERTLGLIEMLLDSFNPLGGGADLGETITPTPLDPIIALYRNRDWTGKPIAKEDFSSLDPTPGHTRARDSATPWATGLSEFLNWASGGTEFTPGMASPTPDQIDYLIGQVFGGVGREISKAAQTLSSAAAGTDLPSYKVPLVGRMWGDTKQAAAERSRYYDNLKLLNGHDREIKGRRESGRGATVAEYIRGNPEARLVPFAREVERDIRALDKRRRELLERDASKETIRLVEQQIANRMRAFNERVAALEE